MAPRRSPSTLGGRKSPSFAVRPPMCLNPCSRRLVWTSLLCQIWIILPTFSSLRELNEIIHWKQPASQWVSNKCSLCSSFYHQGSLLEGFIYSHCLTKWTGMIRNRTEVSKVGHKEETPRKCNKEQLLPSLPSIHDTIHPIFPPYFY